MVNTPTSIPNWRAAFNSFCNELERLGLSKALKKLIFVVLSGLVFVDEWLLTVENEDLLLVDGILRWISVGNDGSEKDFDLEKM